MINLFIAGGLVMWPLLFFSIISFACIIERFIFWKRVISSNRNNLNLIAEKFSNLENLQQSKNKNDLYNPYKKLLLKVKEFNLNNQKNLSIALTISLKSIQYEFEKFNNFFCNNKSHIIFTRTFRNSFRFNKFILIYWNTKY